MLHEQKVLMTPGPLCTSSKVKQAMQVDLGTRDNEYGDMVEMMRSQLLHLANVTDKEFQVIFLQGSGTYGVESVVTSVIGKNDKLLILANGAYGQRMAQIAKQAHINYEVHEFSMLEKLPLLEMEALIAKDEITHVGFIHDETTAGVLNDQIAICKLAKSYGKITLIDAMSSFGGIPMDFTNADFIMTSSNKCLHGVPGIAIIFARNEQLARCEGNCSSLSLDLYAQAKAFQYGTGFRFTSPTHVMLALQEAILELLEQGGVAKRYQRYVSLHSQIREFMRSQGFICVVKEEDQAPIITTFEVPKNFNFADFYDYLKNHGILLYSGKLPGIDAFRIGNIGEIDDADVAKFKELVKAYQKGDQK